MGSISLSLHSEYCHELHDWGTGKAGRGWKRLKEAGRGWRRLEEAGEGWRKLDETPGDWRKQAFIPLLIGHSVPKPRIIM